VKKIIAILSFLGIILSSGWMCYAQNIRTEPGGGGPGEPPTGFEGSVINRNAAYFRTWDVIEVTQDTITLQRSKTNGELDTVQIARSRRPYLRPGDQVRYSKKKNQLRKTLR
jgi:hypothetical protein